MIKTVVRIWAVDDIRFGMAITTVARWQLDELADIELIVCEESKFHDSWKKFPIHFLPAENFCQKSIETIQQIADGKVYAGGDDDMLIYGKHFIERCHAVLDRNPEYGIICAHPTNEIVYQQQSTEVPEICESHAVGGPGLSRSGIISNVPQVTNQQSAGWIDNQYRSKGYKMGYMRDVKYLHLGAHFSFSSPAHCDGY